MRRAPKFFKQLTRGQLTELEAYAAHPARKGEDCLAWLTERGIAASLSAVYRWLRGARAKAEAAKRVNYLHGRAGGDPEAVQELTLQLLDGAIFDKLIASEPLTPQEIKALAAARRLSTRDRAELHKLRREVASVRKALDSGEQRKATSDDVIRAIKSALNIGGVQ